jgi:6-phosphogluconolactonase (cycloisomerase 2 family)
MWPAFRQVLNSTLFRSSALLSLSSSDRARIPLGFELLEDRILLAQLAVAQTICDFDPDFCPDGIDGLSGVQDSVISPDGKHMYAVAGLDNAVVAFSRNATTGELTHVQSVFDTDPGINGLNSARGVAISPDGKHVYVAALLDNSVSTWSRNVTTGALTFVEVLIDGSGTINGLAGANAVTVSPDGKHVYVAGRSDDAVAVFSRNASTGKLTFLEAEFDGVGSVNGLDAAESVIVSPDGKHVYVVGEDDHAIAVFEREDDSLSAEFGKLTFVEAKIDGVGGVDGLHNANTVTIDPTGTHVYVASNRGNLDGIEGDDWVAVFSRNATTGALTFVQAIDERDLAIFDEANRTCSGIGNSDSGVTISPDGKSVYVTNPWWSTLAEFSRNPSTGKLTLVTDVCDGSLEFGGLFAINHVVTSPDGKFIYTASLSNSSVAVVRHLQFDGTTGSDTFTVTVEPTQFTVSINGSTQFFKRSPGKPDMISFNGLDGDDEITVNGSVDDETATFKVKSLVMTGAAYELRVINVESIKVNAGTGTDRANLYDSPGNDNFYGRKTYSYLTGTGFNNRASGFDRVYGFATAGGTADRAFLYDSSGNDQFVGRPTFSYLKGAGFHNQVAKFEQVTGLASQGNDKATLVGSSGKETLIGKFNSSSLTGIVFKLIAKRFDRVIANAKTGIDIAKLFDSAGNDIFLGKPTISYMKGSSFFNKAIGFEKVIGKASNGNDVAKLFDSKGSDKFRGRKVSGTLSGVSFSNSTKGFDKIVAKANAGGIDTLDVKRTGPAAIKYVLFQAGDWENIV